MSRVILICGTLWVTLSLSYGSIDSHTELRAEKRQATSGPCAGIVCAEAPEDNCRKVSSSKGGINACCSDFECTSSDGTVSKHSGIAGSGSQGSSTTFLTPDGKGYKKQHSTSSFSSSSSNSDGPGALKGGFKFNGPKPPPLGSFNMGPPPGFHMPKMPGFDFGKMPSLPPLPKMGQGFGPPPGFGGPPAGFGPPPGFFDPPPWMKNHGKK